MEKSLLEKITPHTFEALKFEAYKLFEQGKF